MNTLKLQQTEILAGDGTSVRLAYDEDADILELFFGDNAIFTQAMIAAAASRPLHFR